MRMRLKRRPVTTFALIATILLTLSASVASVTAAPVQDFGFFTAGQFPLYVTDNTGDVVHQVDASGTASTYATGFTTPIFLAFDASGNLYVADSSDDVVYLVPPGGGSKSTYATGFTNPRGLAFDASGNLYVSDSGDNVVYLVPPGGGARAPMPPGSTKTSTWRSPRAETCTCRTVPTTSSTLCRRAGVQLALSWR